MVGTELLTSEQMQQVDKTCAIPIEQLIENAGRAVAEEIVRRYGARKTVVLCGPGNKGRDGKVAARYLKTWGWPVSISNKLDGVELIIDALYGTGLKSDFIQSLADQINNAGVPIISIDVPSGLDGASGAPRGASVKADLTITFFRKKPGHLLLPGRNLCGEIIVRDIGLRSSALDILDIQLWENTTPNLPEPLAGGHKFNRGHAVIVSGNAMQTGASRLAAMAALKIGAGLVTIAGEATALAVHANHVTAVMLVETKTVKDLSNLLSDKRKNAVCIGPAAGVGEATKRAAQVVLESGSNAVLDADALTSCANEPEQLFEWIRKITVRAVVLTPHEGEFEKLFGSLSGSKLERARKAAKQSGAIIILKGADTVIAHPNGRAKINANAPPSLATAGSGDVLAGLVTGLLAQGMTGFAAACAGVWLHGEAANRISSNLFTAEDLVEKLGHIN